LSLNKNNLVTHVTDLMTAVPHLSFDLDYYHSHCHMTFQGDGVSGISKGTATVKIYDYDLNNFKIDIG